MIWLIFRSLLRNLVNKYILIKTVIRFLSSSSSLKKKKGI